MCRFGFYIALFVVIISAANEVLAGETIGDERELYFENSWLQNPRVHSREITERFVFEETDVYHNGNDSMVIRLTNGYALAPIINKGDYAYDKTRFKVAKIDVVFTKYPFDKKDWLTNYYDLLAWRLLALFGLDPSLNNTDISWNMVLQTDCKTAGAAKQMFHGIVLYLEPVAVDGDGITFLEEDDPVDVPASSIINGGFIMREDRDPAYFMIPLQYQPDPGRPLRRNMDPKKLKCPTWR